MNKRNIVYIAKSLDGYIAGKNGDIDWLESVPNTENDHMGYPDLMDEIDAIVMGRVTFETVLSFGVEWPYKKYVYVLSSSMKAVPADLAAKVAIISGSPQEVLDLIHEQGHGVLYIDGGTTIQRFLQEDLIDELRITTFPILLGGGFSLFGELDEPLHFDHVRSSKHLGQLVQDHYIRRR